MFVGLVNPRTLLVYAVIIVALIIAIVVVRFKLRD